MSFLIPAREAVDDRREVVEALVDWPYFEIHCVFLAQILAQFQLSHLSALFFFETGSLVGFVVLKLTLRLRGSAELQLAMLQRN